MGYHVTILRTKGSAQVPIARAEVEAVLATRPDLEWKATAEGHLDVWIRALGDESPLLTWQDGEIWTKNPEDDTVRLMLELAAPLGARVRGDEGETYRTPAESYVHPDDAKRARADEDGATARRWAKTLAPVVIAMLLGLLYGYFTRRR